MTGGLLGGTPGLGVVSNGFAIPANEGDELGQLIAAAGSVTNLIASVAGASIGPLPLLVPAVLGAISWGSYAANEAAS